MQGSKSEFFSKSQKKDRRFDDGMNKESHKKNNFHKQQRQKGQSKHDSR